LSPAHPAGLSYAASAVTSGHLLHHEHTAASIHGACHSALLTFNKLFPSIPAENTKKLLLIFFLTISACQ
jgi:hypothetical protein